MTLSCHSSIHASKYVASSCSGPSQLERGVSPEQQPEQPEQQPEQQEVSRPSESTESCGAASHTGSSARARVYAEDTEGSWVEEQSGVRIAHLQLSSEGLVSCPVPCTESERPPRTRRQVYVAAQDIIGVQRHTSPHRLTIVAYRLTARPSSSWWSSGSTETGRARLVRQEITLVAAHGSSSSSGCDSRPPYPGPAQKKEQQAVDEANRRLVEDWHVAVLQLLGRTAEQLQKSLLVLINPTSGPQRALQMWKRVGEPVIATEGGHKVHVIVTQRANHAREFVQQHVDLAGTFKGIVIVSGDGLLSEVLQGVMARPDWARCIRDLPFGVLPAGTGNGLARSIHARAGLPHSALSACVLIAKGTTQPLDVGAVDIMSSSSHSLSSSSTKVMRRYSFLSLEWGLSADIDIGSEYMRCLGEARFTIEVSLVSESRRRAEGGTEEEQRTNRGGTEDEQRGSGQTCVHA